MFVFGDIKWLVVIFTEAIARWYIVRITAPCSQLFCKKVLKNPAKSLGKHLCQSLVFNKVAGLQPGTLFKKDAAALVFSRVSCKFFKNTFLIDYSIHLCDWLLHCVKSVSIGSFSGPYFPVFGLNTERYR